MVVILSPVRQLLADIVEREEHLDIQALISKPPIENLDEAILDGLARSNKVELNPMAIGPGINGRFPVRLLRDGSHPVLRVLHFSEEMCPGHRGKVRLLHN